MALVWFVIILALIEYFIFSLAVGRARATYKIEAPAIIGNADFERVYRVHMNTLEQLIMFVPSMLGFAAYVSAPWAAGLGAVYIVGRWVYFVGYKRAAKKRGIGFAISSIPVLVLMIGTLIGAGMAVYRGAAPALIEHHADDRNQ